MPSDVKNIRRTQGILEEDLRKVLATMAEYIVKLPKENYDKTAFVMLNTHIQSGLKHAYDNVYNKFLQETQYFMDYMQMRNQQYKVLENIYDKIVSLEDVPVQAAEIATFIQHISISLAETNNAKTLLIECDQLFVKFQNSPLPTTRKEFETRAVLYMILKDFAYFLKLKETFANELTIETKEKYWGST
jgi:uncharacterized membrane protein YgaE (UPF0421/DUF939 family)